MSKDWSARGDAMLIAGEALSQHDSSPASPVNTSAAARVAAAPGRTMFYAPGFDPYLILAQISCMQSALYLSFGLWLVVLTVLSGNSLASISLRQVFSHNAMRVSFTNGWIPIVAYLLNAFFG